MKSKTTKKAENIVHSIIDTIENNDMDYKMPVHLGPDILNMKRANGSLFGTNNSVLLLLQATKIISFELDGDYTELSQYWFTANQGRNEGAYIKKGSKAAYVYKPIIKNYPAHKISESTKRTAKKQPDGSYDVFIAWHMYPVFNASQFHNMPKQFLADENQNISYQVDDVESEIIQSIEDEGISLQHGIKSNSFAYYSPLHDSIHMHEKYNYRSHSAYLATLTHEVGHALGAYHRLNLFNDTFISCNKSLAYEEIRAELTGALLLGSKGIGPEVRHDHAPYIDSFLKALKQDPLFLLQIAPECHKAVCFFSNMNDQLRDKYLHTPSPVERIIVNHFRMQEDDPYDACNMVDRFNDDKDYRIYSVDKMSNRLNSHGVNTLCSREYEIFKSLNKNELTEFLSKTIQPLRQDIKTTQEHDNETLCIS